jgi:hypothetical protein
LAHADHLATVQDGAADNLVHDVVAGRAGLRLDVDDSRLFIHASRDRTIDVEEQRVNRPG